MGASRCHPDAMTKSSRPKGALTETASQSKRNFMINLALTALSLVLLILADDRVWIYWLRAAVTITWATLAVLYFRSWRILRRPDAGATRFGP